MRSSRGLLESGGVLTAIASLLHVAIVAGGPEWYRFFGAGERMARLAARGSPYPAAVTLAIASVLAIWSLYAFSGAGIIRRLPLLRPVLVLIATIFFFRAVAGVPLVTLLDHPYARELSARMMFMVVSSAICLVLGLLYGMGAAALRRDVAADERRAV